MSLKSGEELELSILVKMYDYEEKCTNDFNPILMAIPL